MEIVKLTDETAIETMKTHLERALDDGAVKIFQVVGKYGIGKRTAVRSVTSVHQISTANCFRTVQGQ